MSKGFSEQCGPISHDEANNIAMGYIDHCFGNKEKPERRITHSIPANPRRDSDLRLTAYIDQQRERDERLIRAMAVVDHLLKHHAETSVCLIGGNCRDDGTHAEDCPLVVHGFVGLDGTRKA